MISDTALYVYGDPLSIMKPFIAAFLATYPLCQGARVVDLTPGCGAVAQVRRALRS